MTARTGAGLPATPDPDAAIYARSLTMAASQSYDGVRSGHENQG